MPWPKAKNPLLLWRRRTLAQSLPKKSTLKVLICWKWLGKAATERYFTLNSAASHVSQVFQVKKKTGPDAGTIYAMKVLKKVWSSVAPKIYLLFRPLSSEARRTSFTPNQNEIFWRKLRWGIFFLSCNLLVFRLAPKFGASCPQSFCNIRQSPFIVSLDYAFQTDGKLYLILEYLSGTFLAGNARAQW